MAGLTELEVDVLHRVRRASRNHDDRPTPWTVLQPLYTELCTLIADADVSASDLVAFIGQHGGEVLGARMLQSRGMKIGRGRDTYTVLMRAVEADNLMAVTVLCHAMSRHQFTIFNGDFDTCLHLAIRKRGPGFENLIPLTIVEHMHPDDLDVCDEMNMRPLMLCVLCNASDVARSISERNPGTWKSRDAWNRTAAHLCCSEELSEDMLSVVMEFAPDSVFKQSSRENESTPLMAALKSKNEAAIDAVIARTPARAHVNVERGWNPFSSPSLPNYENDVTAAAAFGSLPIFQRIENRLDVPDSLLGQLWRMAAKSAIVTGNMDVLEYLVESHGDDLIVGDIDLILTGLVTSQSVATVTWVMDFDPKIMQRFVDPEGPQWIGKLMHNEQPVIDCVLERLLQMDRKTVLGVFLHEGLIPIIDFNCLTKFSALLAAFPEVLDPPELLFRAIRIGSVKQVALILSINPGAVNFCNAERQTPLEHAAFVNAREELMVLLKQNYKVKSSVDA